MEESEAQVWGENISAKRIRIDVDKDLQDLRKSHLAAVTTQLGREVRVFASPVAGNWNGPRPVPDEPDDFYELTNDDYIRLMASKKEDNILKTKKEREAEEAARRTKITKAVIRVQFPDNYIIEADFQPSETISTLVDLLKKVVAKPDVPFYIYTTPPKKRITDLTKDFYSSNHVPCQLVHFHYDIQGGCFLVLHLKSCPYCSKCSFDAESVTPKTFLCFHDTIWKWLQSYQMYH